MISTIARFLENRFSVPYDDAIIYLNRLTVTLAAALFVLSATLIVAFEDVFPGQSSVSSLQIGDVAGKNILAPQRSSYESEVLTEQQREAARQAVFPIFDPPDAQVARQQTELAHQIINFIDDVRYDSFSSLEQKTDDIQDITTLNLDELTISYILELDSDTWQSVGTEINTVMERVMRNEIKDSDLSRIKASLSNQVSTRFNFRESRVIESIVRDLIRPNTVLNEEATEAVQQRAANDVPVETRSFVAGQIVVVSGEEIDEADYEALEKLGLLRPTASRTQGVARALVGSIMVMVIIGLYIARFRPSVLYGEPRFLLLLATIFIIMLFGARFGLSGEIYLYPTAAMALLFVAIDGTEIAIVGTIGLSLLLGLMTNDSLEITTLTMLGGIIGALTLRRAERLNSFFFAGLMVMASNVAVAAVFNLGTPSANGAGELILLVFYSFINGILSATAAMAGMYIVTLLFNLPTALKLVELSQPSQPLLQRLLREAPGTYQHSLQVANMTEQVATAIGANAELAHVAALYHDIGKILNPAFFTENQRDIGNPHDALNDPYRSADIIIGHITGGAELARQYRLPKRIRDFILEHQGTGQVYVFYRQAVILAGDDESLVNPDDFTYPGPKPQSKETAILMLADGCEAAVRSRQPKTKQEIEETITMVIDGKRKDGQLDESHLTLNDLKKTHDIFVEMMQAVFHPRINYAEAVEKVRKGKKDTVKIPAVTATDSMVKKQPETNGDKEKAVIKTPSPKPKAPTPAPTPAVDSAAIHTNGDDDDDSPLPEVPRLRRTDNNKSSQSSTNNDSEKRDEKTPEKQETDGEQTK